MGLIKKGILGGVSGKVGTVVGASWLGTDYIRATPVYRKKHIPTPGQAAQRLKMSLLRGFLLSIRTLVERSYQNFKEKKAMNAALSYNMQNAITGSNTELQISFPNIIFSKGELMAGWYPAAISVEPSVIDFSWETGPYSLTCRANDQVTLVVYDPVKESFSVSLNAAKREDGTARITVPNNFKGHSIHCYICFYSEELKISSTNQYLGEVIVQDI